MTTETDQEILKLQKIIDGYKDTLKDKTAVELEGAKIQLSNYEKELKYLKGKSQRELISTYFYWERSAAVIVDITPEKSRAFILRVLKEHEGWKEATPDQVKDFFIDGSRLSKSEFEKEFGVIGDNLPNLPLEIK